MKIVIIYSSLSCYKPVWFFFFFSENKIKYFVSKLLLDPNEFHTMDVNGDQQLFGYPQSSKYIFIFNRRKKFIHVS